MIARAAHEYKAPASTVSSNNNIWAMRKFTLLLPLTHTGFSVIKIGPIIPFKFMFLRLTINCKNIMH